MVRSSEIAKKTTDEKDPQKADASSAFLRLGEIMQVKTPDGATAKQARAAVDDTSVSPEGVSIRQETGKSDDEMSGIRRELAESRRETEATRKETDAAFQPQTPYNMSELYADAMNSMREIRTAVVRNLPLDIAPASELVQKIVSQPALIRDTHPLTLGSENEQDYYIFQPIHTMFYALKIGLHMAYRPGQLLNLGLCCLLQNLGMFLIPDDILNKTGPLTAEEISAIRQHPETGRNLLIPFEADYPWLLKTVYQHHERESGQGYPLGIRGDEIMEYAKIIGLCDSYEAMTHKRPHRKAIMQFDSVKQLIESKERLFSPQILKLFLTELTIYPMGSYVRLNNAAIGRVTATNKSQPMRPVIRLLIDGKGHRVTENETIDLAHNNVLTILDVVPEEDIPL